MCFSIVMRINNFNTSPMFSANLNSPKLNFKYDDFFVKIRGYGKNRDWAYKIIETADTAACLIRKNTTAENVLKYVISGVRDANQKDMSLSKREFTGILRTKRQGWLCCDWCDIITPYSKNRYSAYETRLDKTAESPNKSMLGIRFSRPRIYSDNYKEIVHASSLYVNDALDKIFSLSKKIFPKYIKEDVKPENLDEVNSAIAEIRWIMAHATPWQRGSDAISNVFMRAMYKAIGVKTFPLAKGVSLDLEAYCTELEEYKRKFAGYFEKAPEVVE